MNDEDLLNGVRRVARERDPAADPRWDGLAAGTLAAEDLAALERDAAESEPMAEALRVFQPLSREVNERMIDQVLATMEPRRRVAHRRRSMVMALLAAAFLVALALVIRRSDPGPIAGYTIALSGGERAMRAEPTQPQSVLLLEDPETRLQVTLRPATELRGEVAIRAAMVQPGRVRPWDPPFTIAPGGTILVAGTKDELFAGAPEGAWDLVFAVGRPGALPTSAELAREQGGVGVQVLRGRVVLRRPTTPDR